MACDSTGAMLHGVIKPIVKWAGGKAWLAPTVVAAFGDDVGGRVYVEPFLGGGAVFFQRPRQAILCDANERLMATYRAVRDDAPEVCRILDGMTDDEGTYYAVRKAFNGELPPAEAAAAFIYLNKRCHNGLYRVNKRGEFNVPFAADRVGRRPIGTQNIARAGVALKLASLVTGDSLGALGHLTGNSKTHLDVFVDPPYLDTFDAYTAEGFGLAEHTRLAGYLRAIAEVPGNRVIATNLDTPVVRELYDWAELTAVPRHHAMGRTLANELVMTKGVKL